MDVVRFLGAVLERSFDNGGAVRNCLTERAARALVETEIDRLEARLPAAEPAPQRLTA